MSGTGLARMTADERHAFIHHMIEALERPNRELTEWEDNFMGSIKIQFQQGRNLSNKQVEILERIYAEKTE